MLSKWERNNNPSCHRFLSSELGQSSREGVHPNEMYLGPHVQVLTCAKTILFFPNRQRESKLLREFALLCGSFLSSLQNISEWLIFLS